MCSVAPDVVSWRLWCGNWRGVVSCCWMEWATHAVASRGWRCCRVQLCPHCLSAAGSICCWQMVSVSACVTADSCVCPCRSVSFCLVDFGAVVRCICVEDYYMFRENWPLYVMPLVIPENLTCYEVCSIWNGCSSSCFISIWNLPLAFPGSSTTVTVVTVPGML